MSQSITIETYARAPLEKVWADFTNPEAIKVWNAASPDWHTTQAESDLRVGGAFCHRMEAKDGSQGFDLKGVYTDINQPERLAYTLSDGRKVNLAFTAEENGVRVTETFEPETANTHELQRAGWQAILDNFKKYVESSTDV